MGALHLSLRQLQIFASVAHQGSTAAAGQQISLSQSATSAAVKELERLLGQSLFDRSGKRLLLNENGRTLLPMALALLDAAATIEQTAHNGQAQARSLRVGASTTIGNYLLPALLAQHVGDPTGHGAAGSPPSRAVIGNTAAICEALAAFELDIGLIEGPCHQSGLRATPWLDDELLIVAAPATAAALGSRAESEGDHWTLDALRACRWLVRESGSGTREASDRWLLPHLGTYDTILELGSSEALKRAAAAGLGLACLSRWVVEDFLEAGRLRCIEAPFPGVSRQCYWVVHRDKQMTVALQRFIDHISVRAEPSRSSTR